ncbi:MAG: hypothetical protein GY757_13975 [bacterium]|nr:hypothetical protein [bacterium]
MKCKDFRKLLHLNREGELSRRQERKLERHLLTCTDCAMEKRQIEDADDIIRLARASNPRPVNPEFLTDAIMDAIEPAQPATAPFFPASKWFDWLLMPSVRPAAAGIVLVIVGIFIFQGVSLFQRIDQLEQKLARQGTGESSKRGFISKNMVRTATARSLENTGRLYRSHREVYNGGGQPLVLDKKNTLRLLKIIRNRLQEDMELLRFLEEKLLSGTDVDFDDGIQHGELKKLLEKNKTLIEGIHKL